MEGNVFPANTMFGNPSDTAMDLDYMDELLLQGCWLETTDGSEFFSHTPSIPSPLFDPSLIWPTLEADNSKPGPSSLQKDTQEERQISSFPENLSALIRPQEQNNEKNQLISHNMNNVSGGSNQSGNSLVEGSRFSRRMWIGPRAMPGLGSTVMDRLMMALDYIKDSTRDKDVLVQIWVPVNSQGRRVLTTNNQPYSLGHSSLKLANYRDISVNYHFPAEEDSKELVGLPGRVFMGRVPEWTPDVRFFRSEEYPRVNHAQQCDVRGTLAVPVFEHGSLNCLGVIEVIMTTQKIKYLPELESVCKALEAVDLRTSGVSSPQDVKALYGSYQAVLPEILEVLKSACGTHRLPLAQTWISCVQQGKGGCRHSDENYAHCVSTVDSACHVADPRFQGFHEACSEHHLLRGQGVAGRAFTTNQPCFSPDITSFSKTEYPLSHHARMFGLQAAVAIRLRSIYSGIADFVLEFFLPTECTDSEEQKKVLISLSIILQRVCHSLRVITDKELEEETVLPLSEARASLDAIPKVIPSLQHPQPERSLQEVSSWTGGQREVQEIDNFVPTLPFGKQKGLLIEKSSDFGQSPRDASSRLSDALGEECSTFSEGTFSAMGKTDERRRTKAEKNITLQILRQYFAGSLKDAAKSIGVCPTTLKRICRQHGIKRWPSRKIKKVGHSLQKLQLVIDSVQGASGALQIESFYSNFPELATSNLSGTSSFISPKPYGQASHSSKLPESGISQAVASKPSSSGSQSSSSSQSCSSGTQQQPYTSLAAGSEDPIVEESSDNGAMKRVRSDMELRASNEEPKLLSRSRSQKSLVEQYKLESRPALTKSIGDKSQEGNYQRLKVTYAEEKIRFRMQNEWGYIDLLQEVCRRFGIDDTSEFQLKYLDDDSEWVLLTCDADLEECIDVCQSESNTIKLSLLRVYQQQSVSSLGSNGPL